MTQEYISQCIVFLVILAMLWKAMLVYERNSETISTKIHGSTFLTFIADSVYPIAVGFVIMIACVYTIWNNPNVIMGLFQ